MRYLLLYLCFLVFSTVQSLEYEVQIDNDFVNVVRVKIMPQEESWLHRDDYEHVVVALQGGVITRLEADGSTTDVNFPTGRAVFRGIDPPNQLHKSVNNSHDSIELIITYLKISKSFH